jgi:hypothetical protein
MFKGAVVSGLVSVLLLAQAAQAQRKVPRKAPPKAVEKAQPVDDVYQAGEIRRIVKGDESPLLHLGMAASGAAVIEFPASDHYFGIHTSDIGDWVRVEKSPSRLTDNHLVLRPGKDLQGNESSALVHLQMRSGLLITLCIHPVKFAGQQTRRIVISYDRDEIVAARARAGLAVNLGPERSEVRPAISIPAAEPAPQAIEEKLPPRESVATEPAPQNIEEKQSARESVAAAPAPLEKKTDPQLLEALADALLKATSNPKQQFRKWSAATNGLSVSTRTYDHNEETKIALVAIRNVEDAALRIMPGHPELIVQTVNDKGRVVQLSQVQKLLEKTSAINQVIPAGQAVYYAIAFSPPIMSTKQKLCVTVGQRTAADAPADIDITARRNKK